MRWLRLIASMQLVATGVLIWKVWGLEQALDASTIHAPASAADAVKYSQSNSSASASDSFTEKRLRTIIREELSSVQSLKPNGQIKIQSPPDPEYSREFEVQLQSVSTKVDGLIGTGVISDSEMEKLHFEIGQLHPQDRRLVLSRLAKAINTGTVKLTR